MEAFPRVQAIPVQSQGVSFRIDDVEVARHNAGWDMLRPYLFPVLGPTGRMVTRMGHPHDPSGHRHHYSVWLAHYDINGIDFWSDEPGAGKQIQRLVLALEDGVDSAAAKLAIDWVGGDGATVMTEERTWRLVDLPDNERQIDLHVRLTPKVEPVTFAATSFGLPAVRVAKTICVEDGGGQILNSAGGLGEDAIFWKPAAWCDYSGPVAADEWNGVTMMNHPSNPDHEPDWHVRSDGWMGPCLSREADLELLDTLELRYGLYIHHGSPNEADVTGAYVRFADSEFVPCKQ